jgi:hypothetical protein
MSNIPSTGSALTPVTAFYANTDQTVIQITEDKLHLVLLRYLGDAESARRWQVPLGIVLGLVPVFLTSDFKDVWGIEKATWRAFFMLVILVAVLWLLWSLRYLAKSPTVEHVLQRIKNVAAGEPPPRESGANWWESGWFSRRITTNSGKSDNGDK